MPEQTTGPSWTPEDVELVAGWFKRFFGASVIRQRDRESAIEVLAALAEAGRLREPGATEEWTTIDDTGRLNPLGDIGEELARSVTAEMVARNYSVTPVRRWVGPWLPVNTTDTPKDGPCRSCGHRADTPNHEYGCTPQEKP